MKKIDSQLLSFSTNLKNKSPNTIKSYKSGVKLFLLYLQQKNGTLEYSESDIINYIKKRYDDGLSKKSIIQTVKAINTYSVFFNYGVVLNPSEIEFLNEINDTENELNVLSKKAQEQMYSLLLNIKGKKRRTVLMALLILETGIKISELVALNTQNLYMHNHIPYIKINSNIERILPISPELYDHFEKIIYDECNDIPLFTSGKKRISIRVAQYSFKEHCNITSQILRDSFIYNLIDNDVDTYLIAQLAGLSITDTIIRKFYNKEFKEIPELQI